MFNAIQDAMKTLYGKKQSVFTVFTDWIIIMHDGVTMETFERDQL